jgi:hypothetical protein
MAIKVRGRCSGKKRARNTISLDIGVMMGLNHGSVEVMKGDFAKNYNSAKLKKFPVN